MPMLTYMTDADEIGHAGHDTVDHIVETLHPIIKTSLISAMGNSGDVGLSPTSVSEILVKAISSLDEAIAKDLLDLFPGGPDIIAKLSDGEIRAIINDSESGGKNSAKLMRCMRGSTVLVSLIDPTGSNLWVVSLGDCQAGSVDYSPSYSLFLTL
jgi:pyruvate dehydrogenase phosphatase